MVLANGFMLSRKYYYSSQYMREPGRRGGGGRRGGWGELGGGILLTLSLTSFLFVSHPASTSVSSVFMLFLHSDTILSNISYVNESVLC